MNEILRIDATGLACPQPVLRTREILESDHMGDFIVLVDNEAAKENVCRFARSCGRNVETSELKEDRFEVLIVKGASLDAQGRPIPQMNPNTCMPPQEAQTVVYVGTSCMGRGDEELGRKLMRGFLRTLIDVHPVPWRMIFMNSGVELAVMDEEAVDALVMLQQKGVEILACGTCLQHFGYENDLKVGRITNMYEVVESLKIASKVISPA